MPTEPRLEIQTSPTQTNFAESCVYRASGPVFLAFYSASNLWVCVRASAVTVLREPDARRSPTKIVLLKPKFAPLEGDLSPLHIAAKGTGMIPADA